MPSKQLRGHRGVVHTVGVTPDGILYIDIQRFFGDRTGAVRTFYVRRPDVMRIRRRVSCGRPTPISTPDLVSLFAASFHTAEYALEWLRWAGIRTVRRDDAEACYNAEMQIPAEVMN